MQGLCKPWEHRLSRRAWLGGMSAAGAAAASGLPFDPAFGEELAKQSLALPIYPEMKNKQIERVVQLVKEFYA